MSFDIPTIRVVTTDGTVITTLDNARCESITRTKNQPARAVVKFPKGAYTRDDVHLFADDSGTGDLHEIQIVRGGIVRFWGPAIGATLDSHDGMVSLDCRGVDWYLNRRFLDGERTNFLDNPSFETGDETSWSAVGSMTHTVINTDAVRGTYSLQLESITPLGDIYESQTQSIHAGGVGDVITIVFYFKIIGSLGGHALDRRGLYVEGTVSGVVQANNYYPIDEATPTGVWIRASTTIYVPPFATWDVETRLYSPPGTIIWDDGQNVAFDSIGSNGLTGDTFTPVDVSRLVELFVGFLQTGPGKSDLNIGTDTTDTGVLQVKQVQWADHVSWPDQLSEWIDRDDCFDYSMVYTSTTRDFTMHVPQQGVDRRSGGGAVTLTFPADNVSSYTFAEDGAGTVTDDVELEQDTGNGPDREEGHYADTSLVGGLVLQSVSSAPTGAEPGSLDPIARETVNKNRRPAVLYTFVVTKDGAGDYYDEILDLGDICNFDVTDGWATLAGHGAITQLVEYPANRRLEVTMPRGTF